MEDPGEEVLAKRSELAAYAEHGLSDGKSRCHANRLLVPPPDRPFGACHDGCTPRQPGPEKSVSAFILCSVRVFLQSHSISSRIEPDS